MMENNEEVNVGYVSHPESGGEVSPEIPQMHGIGVVVDGVVQDVLMCDDRLAAMFLSSPVFIEILADNPDGRFVGWEYDKNSNKLTPPQS